MVCQVKNTNNLTWGIFFYMENQKMKFNELLKKITKIQGLKPHELAKKLKVTPQYIHHLEAEKTGLPTRQFCENLSKVSGVDFNEIWQTVGRDRLTRALNREQITEKEAAQFFKTEITATKKDHTDPESLMIIDHCKKMTREEKQEVLRYLEDKKFAKERREEIARARAES